MSEAAFAQLLATYGYLAVFVGCLLEGETILMLAGFAAHQGYMSLPLVVGIALFAGWLGDQCFFFIGRRFGARLLGRFPSLTPRVQRVNALLARHHSWIIVSIRFLYGLRVAGPIAIGMSDVPARRFMLFNLLGAAIWAPLIAGIGYLFGESVQWLLADLKHYQLLAALILLALIALAALIRHLRARRRG